MGGLACINQEWERERVCVSVCVCGGGVCNNYYVYKYI